ncbi:MerR family transcriptional regulator [Pseudomonadota bacterium]
MVGTVVLKTKDICEALSIGRHQLRIWTDILSPYNKQQTKARSARHYTPADLLFFAVINHLEDTFGLTPQVISRFSNELSSCIREPQSLVIDTFFFINVEKNVCERLDNRVSAKEGIIVDIKPAQMLVCEFLGLSVQQPQFQFGLVKVK